jgi:D-alanine-D-alanine ligase
METTPHPNRPPGPEAPARTRVLILFGGRSGEHPISCATAGGVLRAIDRTRYDVVPVGITRRGRWVPAEDDPQRWSLDRGELPEVPELPVQVVLPRDADDRELRVVDADGAIRSLGRVDVVLPLVHGPYGEDGTLQGALDLIDLPYVGAGVLASAVGMDKHVMKLLFAAQGLPIGRFAVLRPGAWEASPTVWTETVAGLGLPVFVKPARAGSSLGITKVSSLDQLPEAIAAAHAHDPKVIIEAAIQGREIECAVLGGRGGARARASQPGEIIVLDEKHQFYDFEAKYLDESSVKLDCPADLSPRVIAEVRELALRAFEAIGCEGLARVDCFVTETGKVILNEINTMPGFTPYSMYPRMWEQSGLDYPALIDELIQLALERRTGLR